MKESYSGIYFIGKFIATKSKSEEEAANKYLEMVIGDRTEITREDVINAVIAGIRMIKRGRSVLNADVATQSKIDNESLIKTVGEFLAIRGFLSARIDKNDTPIHVPAKAIYVGYNFPNLDCKETRFSDFCCC